ncbi:Neutral/alkaline non-lysosomal ceramidase [Anatilimnocola aggregata]|uniref:Neutral/alkaline non-lysosomal ceramidase n=1 Tax=Anatilimnocola aggregata TaxID=2528021 RepID=A0A517YFT9_9BACT|nr:hypothetical protein [Anatilimnocola aggregata]QDU29084.1 Neutral/alkaline non-lysosomal ceramidase [Anatilimnocola aggregata]
MQLSPVLSVLFVASVLFQPDFVAGEQLRAGVARIDITDRQAGHVNDPCYAKALVLQSGNVSAVLVTVDAVAIGEIGRLRSNFLATIRQELEQSPGIPPSHVIVNASHCHGIVRADTDQLVIQVVREAWKNLTPVKVGAGTANETRISENRRLNMKDGSQVDMRRAYSMPPDDEVASVGPIDPQIGLLRLDREDGRPLAVVYNFACHPIMNPPSKGNSADYPGFASAVIEDSLGHGALALFVQGCGGDINPVRYKEVSRPPDAEPLGNLLGNSVLRAVREIQTKGDAQLAVKQQQISLPRAADFQKRISTIEAEQGRLLRSLKPTNINFKTFLPLLIQQRMSPDFPSHYSQSYLQDKAQGRDELERLDKENRTQVEAYLANIHAMEQLTRLNTNLALLNKHRAAAEAAAVQTIDVEVCALRVGDFKLLTFPGELTVEIGLGIKQSAKDPHAFVAGYTNGYIYYSPTVAQRMNKGFAQEDCDCIVAPEWQRIFESAALEMLRKL